MRISGCEFLVEEEVEPDGECLEGQKMNAHLRGRGVRRRHLRVSFFTGAGAGGFIPNMKEALDRAEGDAQVFRQMYTESKKDTGPKLGCIGYFSLFTDYDAASAQGQGVPLDSYVHEAVVSDDYLGGSAADTESPPKLHFLHSRARFETEVLGCPFHVCGSYFAQQQARVFCCAHVATMTCIRNIHTALGSGRNLTYEEMNRYLILQR